MSREPHHEQWQPDEVPIWNTRLAQATYVVALLTVMGALVYGIAYR
ncbi:hypothetical protein [Streptomyces sp. NPDC018693]